MYIVHSCMPSLYNIHVYETDARVSSSGYICSLCVCVCVLVRACLRILKQSLHNMDKITVISSERVQQT